MTLPPGLVAALAARLPADDAVERPPMQLATVDADGRPDLRTVLLSSWSADGFAFHTDAGSRKAGQLATNGAVALCLVGTAGQIVVRGQAEPLAPERAAAAYAARSPYLRQLAWQNTVELAAVDEADRRRAWADFARTHDIAALEPPPGWAGYFVVPDRVTLWTADVAGPSHRDEFVRGADDAWQQRPLPG